MEAVVLNFFLNMATETLTLECHSARNFLLYKLWNSVSFSHQLPRDHFRMHYSNVSHKTLRNNVT